jgi:hypothetical protein
VYAAADPKLHDKVAGIICLNTPFISVIRRDYTTRLALLTMLAVVAPIMWAAGGLWNRIENSLMEGIVLLGAIVVLAFTASGAALLVRSFHNKGKVMLNRLKPTHVQDVPVLCISAGDDEAQYGLALLEHVANLPTVLQHPLVMAGLFVSVLGMQITGVLPTLSFLGLSLGPGSGPFMYVLGFFLVLQVIALGLSFVVGRIALGLGFSYWPLLYNFFARVVVTPTPLYYRLVDFIDVVIPAVKGRSSLAHSRVYQDDRAIQEVVSWIKNGCELTLNGKEVNEVETPRN